MLQKHLKDVPVPVLDGPLQRSEPLLILGIGIGVVVQKKPGNLCHAFAQAGGIFDGS